MKKQILSLIACTTFFATNPAFCMLEEEKEITKTINLNVFHVALLGKKHEPINKDFNLYFRARANSAFSVEKLDFKPLDKDNGLWQAQIRNLVIRSEEMSSKPKTLEFFINDGKNKDKRINEYDKPYCDIQTKEGNDIRNLYKVQCMNYEREYSLEFRKIESGSVFDITIMDYDVPTFQFQCLLEKQQKTPFKILPHQAVRYLKNVPGKDFGSGFKCAETAFTKMPSGSGFPHWFPLYGFDKFEELVDPPRTAYKELTPLQRIEALEDQQLKIQRKVQCGKTLFDFRHLKKLSQEEFDTYINLDILHLKWVLPQIEEAFGRGEEIAHIARQFEIPEFCVFHILGKNPGGDYVEKMSYTCTDNEAPYGDEIPQIKEALQKGIGSSEIAKSFRITESYVTRIQEQSNTSGDAIPKTSSSRTPSKDDEPSMDD